MYFLSHKFGHFTVYSNLCLIDKVKHSHIDQLLEVSIIVKNSSPPQLWANCWLSVGRRLVNIRPTVDQQLTDYSPTVDQQVADSWSQTTGKQPVVLVKIVG